MYYYNDNNDDDNSTNSDTHSRPLFSQSFDPSSLNGGGMPISYNEHTEHSYDPLNDSSLFANNHYNDNWGLQLQDNMDFSSLQQQEAILLSDPNFLRQHQLLQDQQKEMHTRLVNDENNTGQDSVMLSNLTAMFEPQHSIKQEQITPEEAEEEDKKTKKNRRQQTVMKNSENENDNDAKIDHQRRFNELQARFRVNYARKPSQQQQQQQQIGNPAKSPTAANTKPVKQQLLPQQPPQHLSSPLQKSLSIPQPQPQSQPQPIVQTNNTNTNPTLSSTPPVMIGGLVMINNINNNNANNANADFLNTNSEGSPSSSFPSRTTPIQIERVARHSNSQQFDAESHQKQLDNQLDKVDFNDITVSELKEMLRQRGKPATGKKAILLQRLQEERDIAKNGGRRLNRHSQPLPFSRSIDSTSQQQQQSSRPRSFQGGMSSSPVMIQNSYHNQHDNLLLLSGSPSSPQTSASFIPGSPSSSLHRSIANMHIGSPPANNNSRRYSPYSPRLSSSPKLTHHEYSSSVPLSSGDNLSSSPLLMNNALPMNNSSNNNNDNMMLSSSYSVAANSRPSCRYYSNPKTYKPFMSSALATPDREEDVNPFDSYYAGGDDSPIKEEEASLEEPSQYLDMNNNVNNMDWLDPSQFELLLQQQGKIMYSTFCVFLLSNIFFSRSSTNE
jgi:hypothetical protein